MHNTSIRIGYGSALALFVSFIVWIACFAGIAYFEEIAATSHLFTWTDLDAYLEHYRATGRFFQHLAYLFMVLTGPAYLLLVNSYHDYAEASKKVLSRAALLFALAFAVLSGLHYFVQLGAARFNLQEGAAEGLEFFLQANPHSVMNSIVMLGWTLFLGLSSLFLFPVFGKKERVLRVAFLVNGLSCLLAGAGYLLQIDALTFICINLLTGAALLIVSIASMRQFRRLLKGGGSPGDE
jgi:hypothetical protein